MKKLILALAVISLTAPAFAQYYHGGYGHGHYHGGYHDGYGPGDVDNALTLGALFGSLSVSTLNCSANYDCKQVLAAQDDAAAFIASSGELRSAALDQALLSLRQANPEATAQSSDLDLAAAILQAE